MAISKFDLLFDLMTYLFDFDLINLQDNVWYQATYMDQA